MGDLQSEASHQGLPVLETGLSQQRAALFIIDAAMFRCFNQMFVDDAEGHDIAELRLYSCSGVTETCPKGIHVAVVSQWFMPEFFRTNEDPRSASAPLSATGVAEWSKPTAHNRSGGEGLLQLTTCKMTSDGEGGYKEKIVKLKVVNSAADTGKGDSATIAKGEVDLAEILSRPVEIVLTNDVKLRIKAQINHVASDIDAYEANST